MSRDNICIVKKAGILHNAENTIARERVSARRWAGRENYERVIGTLSGVLLRQRIKNTRARGPSFAVSTYANFKDRARVVHELCIGRAHHVYDARVAVRVLLSHIARFQSARWSICQRDIKNVFDARRRCAMNARLRFATGGNVLIINSRTVG